MKRTRKSLDGFSPDLLRAARQALDPEMTPYGLSKEAGFPPPHQLVTLWESGECCPSPPLLLVIAGTLNVAPRELCSVAHGEEKLVNLRQWAGWNSQKDLADVVGISTIAYKHLEDGRPLSATRMDRRAWRRLADALGVKEEKARDAWRNSHRALRNSMT